MAQTSVVYLTDHSLEPWLEKVCQRKLVEVIGDKPLISATQQALDFGENVAVGDIGRSGLSMCRQTLAALERVKTPFVAIAEHDCLYSAEHFDFVPPDRENFYYNDNVWLYQLSNPNHPELDRMFSKIGGRRAQSQLTCGTEIFIEATRARIEMMSDPAWLKKNPSGRIGEPGAINWDKIMRASRGESVRHVRRAIEAYVNRYSAKDWSSQIPNIDIRHGANFTGPRRGNHRRYEIHPWGRGEDLFA